MRDLLFAFTAFCARSHSRFALLASLVLRPTAAYRQPLTYNLSVTREVLKQIYVAERLQPPTSVSQVTSAYLTLWRRAASPSYWREVARSGEWARIGVYAAEAYGIYKVRFDSRFSSRALLLRTAC